MQTGGDMKCRERNDSDRYIFGNFRPELGEAMLESPQEKCAINYDCCWHAWHQKFAPGSGLELISALASASRRLAGDWIASM